ncbi:spliceosome-associated protein CWC15 homolog [Diadema setosum]|uniref:spliceosome-associated protein CWC15 homolog n=1 Tax=Diadema setosum TaxID=31175 RepID=UPI003B3A188B
MTTAARPTFDPARGGRGKGEGDLSALSKQYSSRDLPAHTKLKYRQPGQDTSDELRSRDFRKDLEERERAAREKRSDRGSGRESSSSSSSSNKRPRLEQIPAANLDADDPLDDEDEEDVSDDSDDDTAELLAELNKIKKERAQEQSRKEQEKKVEEERIRTENILSGNPLMSSQKSDFKVKRRWDDDVVFKNCARGEDDKKEKKFINDTLRSEFHQRFLQKYIH